MASSPSERPGVWRQLRAAFIAFHLVAITLMALPAPSGGMSRTAWKQPTVQAEFRAWSGRLNAVGLDWTPAELEERAWDFSVGFMKTREKVLRPFGPYYKYAGTTQSWRMFVAPHRFPSRLEFLVRVDGRWTPIYEARSREYDWRAYQLDHDRMRSAVFRYGWPQFRGPYRSFASFYAERALAEFPEADAFQSRFYNYRTLSPEEALSGKDPDGKYVGSWVVNR